MTRADVALAVGGSARTPVTGRRAVTDRRAMTGRRTTGRDRGRDGGTR